MPYYNGVFVVSLTVAFPELLNSVHHQYGADDENQHGAARGRLVYIGYVHFISLCCLNL